MVELAEVDESHNYANEIVDKAVEESGPEGFRVLTNFTSKTTPKDALFVTLVVLKHYQMWDKHALDLGMKAPTLEKMPVLYEHFVTIAENDGPAGQSAVFRNYLFAKYATDVKF
ncbi:hypothetical protein H257_15452 [Aphanomyces astaci]|uniref:Uncharacterized protein n=1 Tax=Aphanomyces astaci TaxID=112090 RepID=W4FNY6_APHAT|nr:hypothetical protein H257_15452 [Aphanomyces astaci]ETV68646.1 hypothetical protein H257_15452 [Aphanomyces astaci]|eukprot:XP_009841871.1 hypothetical protein H257_15452 [Aphanomyces astaci]